MKEWYIMFYVGDMIAHPMHGAGVIDSIEERIMDGCTRKYYILKMPAGGMIVMIPTESTEQIGVRPIVDSDSADALMDSFPEISAEMTPNWNRRYRENMQKIKSGDLVEVAKVVKGLMARDVERGLSTGERKMLLSAKQILISEIVLSKKLSYEEVESRINSAMCS
jgi:CarD family transcriptional regulator